MPKQMQGAKRREIQEFAPEALDTIILGLNLRADLGTAEELEELAQDIAHNSQLQPGIVTEDSAGRTVLVAGFRRLAAIQRINANPAAYGLSGPMGLTASYRKLNEEEMLAVNLSENLKRKALSPVDLAHAARKLEGIEGWDLARIARLMEFTPTRVRQLLSLLTLPAKVLRRVHRGELAESAAHAMQGLTPDAITEVLAQTEGAKSSAITRAAKERGRASGQRRSRSMPEIRSGLGALADGVPQARLLLAWINGEPGVELKHAELGDISTAAAGKVLRRLRREEE